MKMFKLAAKSCGFSFQYDKSLKCYKFTRGLTVVYYSKHDLLYMGVAKLIIKLSTMDEE